MYVCHIFFIQPSIDGYSGCFHVLGVVNSAAVNTVLHAFFQIVVSSGHVSGCNIPYIYFETLGNCYQKKTKMKIYTALTIRKVKVYCLLGEKCSPDRIHCRISL